ncbi:MAG: AI-2E family transporter [Proteobacteria bacterium]|nr:AI-2E family transporter [Pseudomonadota bacterium]
MARTSRDMILWFFLALFLCSLLLMGKLFWPFMSVLVLGAVVTGIFYPVYLWIRKKLSPAYASFLTCILIFFVLFVPMVFFITVLTKEAHGFVLYVRDANLANQLITLLENKKILERLNTFLANFDIKLSYAELVKPISDLSNFIGLFLLNQAKSIAGHLLNFVINFCLILVITFYLLIDGKRLVWFIIDLSPLPNDEDVILFKKFKEMSGAVLIGNGLSGMIQGFLGGLIFAFFSLPSPILWGVIMAFLAFLPIVGIGIVFISASLFMLLKGRVAAFVGMLILYALLSGGVEYIFKPILVGKRVKMHALLVFLSIIGGIYMSGILGIIYGPLIVTFFLTLTDIYNSNYRSLIDPEIKPAADDINLI